MQATGPAAKSARYLQPYSILFLRFRPKFTGEAVYFSYLPLNDSAGFHQVVERAKIEYAPNRRWKFGAGYAGANIPGRPWVNRPLITTTISTKSAGAVEFWLQEIPSGAEVQLRYALLHASR